MIQIIIEVKGGCVMSVTSSGPIEVLIDDHDTAQLGPPDVDIDPTYVSDMFTEYTQSTEEDSE